MTGLSAKNVDLSGFSGGSPGTGFSENYERQIDVVYNKSQSVSKYNAFQEAYAGRIESAREFGIDLESPVTPTNFFSLDESFEAFEKDFDEKTSHLDADQRALMGRERMLEKIRERSKRLQTEADFASENSTKMGAVGGFVGNVAGMMFDPFVIATLPLGAGASGFAGKTVLESFARGAVIEGAIAGAVEVPIQVGVQDFQKETLLDPNAGFKAGAINVAGATVGGGLLGGGMAAGIKAYQRKFGSESLNALYREVDGMDAKELARHIRENEGGFTEEQKQAGRELEQKAREEEANPYTAPKHGEAPETKTQSAVKEPAAPEIVQKKVKTVSDAEDDFLKERDPAKFEERLQELNAARLFADQQEKVNKAQFEFDKAKKEVDGLEAGEDDTLEFDRFFEGSKAVDDEDAPITVFHGTDKEFGDFDTTKSTDGKIWFTSRRDLVESGEVGAAGKGRIVSAHLSIKKPAGYDEVDKFFDDDLISQGYDGYILKDGDETTYAVFNSSQIREVRGKKPALKETTIPKAEPKGDTLLQTISKMGGINRQKAIDEFGFDPAQLKGSRAFKKAGGMDADRIAELLAEERYLTLDENGKHDLAELEKLLLAELRGDKQYKIGRDIADDEFEAAFLREVEDVSPELESARMRFAEKQGELNNALRELENAKKFTHEQNLAEANKAMNETRQPDIAENKNNPDPFRVKGERAREDAKELEDFSDPQEGKTAIDEQVREYDVLLEEARANPERADDPIAVGTETDVKKKTTPTVRTFSDIADEIEGDDDFMNGLVGCLR